MSPDADVLEPSSPQLLSGSSSTSSTSSSSSSGSSSTTQPSPQSIDDNNDDDDDDDAMNQASQPDIDKIDDSIPGNSPTHSEVQMIEITTAATQNKTIIKNYLRNQMPVKDLLVHLNVSLDLVRKNANYSPNGF